ncbi:Squalene epoxidase [Hypoxylon texense]
MCRNCYHTTAASFSPSMAITNPELVWPHHQEQKQRAAAAHQASKAQSQPQTETESHIKPSSASTHSESTTYSYDKDKSQAETKQKRSMRQRLKGVFKDMGSPPTSKDDREHGRETTEQTLDHAPMSSSPLGRT